MTLEIERKFLVSEAPDLRSPFMVGAEKIRIVQTNLKVPGAARVRLRQATTHRGGVVYTRTAKTYVTDAIKEEVECEISEPEYQALLALADPNRKTTHKVRRRFKWNGRVFELDQITSPKEMWVLEVELATEEELKTEILLPPGIKIAREVTFERSWSTPRKTGQRR